MVLVWDFIKRRKKLKLIILQYVYYCFSEFIFVVLIRLIDNILN